MWTALGFGCAARLFQSVSRCQACGAFGPNWFSACGSQPGRCYRCCASWASSSRFARGRGCRCGRLCSRRAAAAAAGRRHAALRLLPGLVLHHALGPLLVEDSVAAVAAANYIARLDGVLSAAVAADVCHRRRRCWCAAVAWRCLHDGMQCRQFHCWRRGQSCCEALLL